jgi:hypothetical protein
MAIVSDPDAIALLGLDSDDSLLPLVRAPAEALCKRYLGWDPERSEETEYYPAAERGGKEFYFVGDWGSHPSIGGRHNILQLKRKWVLASDLAVSEFAGAYMEQNDDTDWEALTLGDEFVLDLDNDNLSESGHLKRLGTDWPRLRGSVKVVSTAGFTAAEFAGDTTGATDYTDASDVRYAVFIAVAQAYNEMKAQQKQTGRRAVGPLTGETVPDYSYTIDPTATRALQSMGLDLPPAAKMRLDPFRSYGVVM